MQVLISKSEYISIQEGKSILMTSATYHNQNHQDCITKVHKSWSAPKAHTKPLHKKPTMKKLEGNKEEL
ncbi:hypothetical protein M758_9G032700 [Ceratodon purpureus]|nr:hypothetical protein M758_9G032700 [Ceratodon purpureus]